MKRSIGPMFIIGGILLILIVLFIAYRSCETPVTKIVPTPTPTPTLKEKLDRVEDTLEAIEKKVAEPKAAKGRAAAPARKTAAAPLPMYAYEGDNILGYDVPPRLFVLVETPNAQQHIRLTTPECKQGSWNWPCHIVKPNGIRLHVNHCVAWQADRSVLVKFDQDSCERQKNYNESFGVK